MKGKYNLLSKKLKDMSSTNKLILLVAIIGVLIRLIYIIYTPHYLRQHDSSEYGWTEGHLAYIMYWYQHIQLPDFDPRKLWQFYHPPLHHIIASIWLKLNIMVGFRIETAVENIQILTAFYSCVTSYLSYLIFKELGIKGKGLVVAFTLVCLHPTLILMSGSMNNDILCIMFQTAAILASLRWYKKSNFKNIIWIALCLGLSMMTKTSGILIGFGIGFLFVFKFISCLHTLHSGSKNHEASCKLINLLLQFLTFLIISVPIGMWWNIYTNVKFGIPFGYVPKLSNKLSQYLGDYSNWSRFFDFNLAQVQSVFENWGTPSFEHNIFIAILKTSLFGEYNFGNNASYIIQPATILFGVNVFLCIISIIAMCYICIKKIPNMNYVLKTFLGLIYISVLGSFIKFCIEFPHTCTMDFRYIVPTLLIGSIAIGLTINELDKKNTMLSQVVSFVICAATIVFSFFGVFTYFLLALA